MSFVSSFEIIKVAVSELCIFFLIAEETVAIRNSNGAKIFFAKETATFINGSANLLNNDPRNPPD